MPVLSPRPRLNVNSEQARVLLLLLAFILFGCASSRDVTRASGPGTVEELSVEIIRVLDDSAFVNANWGVLVSSLESGEILFQRNAGKSFIPASNAKIYTTASVLDQLGPDYTYTTRAYVHGTISDGVLNGDLIVRGSGDPVIGGQFNDGDITVLFRSWADSLKTLGIRRINGDIIGDDNTFDDLPMGSAWSWDDEPYWYSAEISALSFNDNSIDFTISGTENGDPAEINWKPHNTSYASVLNRTVTVHQDSSRVPEYGRTRGTNQFQISGLIPAGSTSRISLSVHNPTQFFVHVLRESLTMAGIAVDGLPIDIDLRPDSIDYSQPEMHLLATHVSPPLRDIVKILNKRSHNLYAEMLLKTLGAHNPVPDEDLSPGSAEMGLARAMDTFSAAGADTSRIHLKDGSGLSRMNYVTAEMTSSVLSYMWHHPNDSTRTAFLSSLPVGGVDGTLKSRFLSGPASGKVIAKTGTMTGISSLSGFVSSHSGTPLVFVLMCNQYTVPTSLVRRAQDTIVELLATYRD